MAEVSVAGSETRVRTTSDTMSKGICVRGRYISGESSFLSDRCFTLPTTPTISRIFSPLSSALSPGLIRFPIAFWPGKNLLANRSFTITTGAELI
jgi:hypothetical protein